MAHPYTLPQPSFNVSPKKDIGAPDGDTIKIEQPLRLVSCDTPEKEKPYGTALKAQPKLDKTKQRLQNGFFPQLPQGLIDYFMDRITHDAAKRHILAGKAASAHFEKIKDARLNHPEGKRRKVGVLPCGEVFDRNGRMLAYIMPYLEKPLPPKNDPVRKTFNLQLVEDGWAVFFPVWPSLPKDPTDFYLMHVAAQNAWEGRTGMWQKYGSDLLLPYEYRLLMKLSEEKKANELLENAFQRLCVDLRTLEIKDKFDFYTVPPGDRFWIWEKDWKKEKNKIVSMFGVRK